MLSRVASTSAKHPWWVSAAVLAVALLAFSGFARVQQASIQDQFTPTGLPESDALDAVRAAWPEGGTLFVLLFQGEPLSPAALRENEALAFALRAQPTVGSVASLAGILAGATGRTFAESSDADIDATVARAKNETPGLVASFSAPDAALLQVRMVDGLDGVDAADALDAAIAAAWLGDPARVLATGAAYAERAAEGAGAGDVQVLLPIALGVMLLVLAILFRRPTDVALPFVTVLLALGLSYATLPWLGIPFSPLMFSVGPVVLGIGIDYMLHIVYAFRSSDVTHTSAARMGEAADEVGKAVAFTAVTTLIGFGSFLLSPIPQIRDWGAFIGAGALWSFLLGFTLLPALYGLRARHPAPKPGLIDRLANLLPRIANHPTAALVTVGVITLGLGIAAFQVPVEPIVGVELDETLPETQALRAFDARFGGAATAIVYVRGDALALASPIASLSDALLSIDGVSRVESITTRARGGDLAAAVASSPDLVAPSATRILVFYDQTAEPDIIRKLRDDVTASNLDATLTGRGALSLASQETLLPNLVLSTGIAFGLVLVMLAIFFRRPVWTLIAFVPLVLVLVWQLGAQTLLRIPVDPVTGVTTAMVIGVGVDFSLHATARAQRAIDNGRTREEAASAALRDIGPPVLAGAVSTVAAFLVLGLSDLTQLRVFGRVAAVVVFGAFLVAILFVPAIVHLGAGRPARQKKAA